MPAPIVPGVVEHLLEPFGEGGFDEHLFSEKRMSHERYSSRIMRTGKRETGRSGSASGTGSASVTTCVISAETAANRRVNEGGMNVASLAIPLTSLFDLTNLGAAATAGGFRFVPPYEHERTVLVHGRDDAAPQCGGDRLWLPIRSHGLPSARGNRLRQHIRLQRRCRARPRHACHSTGRTHDPGAVRGGQDTHTNALETTVCCCFAHDTHDGGSCDFGPSSATASNHRATPNTVAPRLPPPPVPTGCTGVVVVWYQIRVDNHPRWLDRNSAPGLPASCLPLAPPF